MKSKTSFYDWKMLKRHFTRFWPVWTLLAVFIVSQFSISILTSDYEIPQRALASAICYDLPTLTMLLAIVIAGCIFSYLHKARSCMMLHALPSRREALYRSGVIAGFSVFALPWTVAMLLLLPSVSFTLMMKSWFVGMMMYLLFYGLAVFSMIFCGKTIAAVCVYMAINIIVPAMESEIKAALSPMLYGLELSGSSLVGFAPEMYLPSNALWITSSGVDNIQFDALYISILAVSGIVLLLCGELLYRRRKMETVGSVIAYPKAMHAVLYLATFCIALIFGNSLYETAFGILPPKETAWVLLLLILLCGLIVFFTMLMLLRMTPRVFKAKAFLGYGGFSLLLVVAFLLFYFDCFGIVSYVPRAEEVDTVSLYFHATDVPSQMKVILTDAEDIAEIYDIHETLIEEIDADLMGYTLNIDYEIDGEILHRRYHVSSEGRNRIYQDLREVVDNEKNVTAHFDRLLQETAQEYLIGGFDDDVLDGFGIKKVIFNPQNLFEAMKQDISEGRMSLMWAFGLENYVGEVIWYDKFGEQMLIMIPATAIHTIEYINQIPSE